jgi:hypothetical protein
MKGTVNAPFAARIGGLLGTRLNSAETVIATVAVSSVVSALCSFVVVSNVYDAFHGVPARSGGVETAAAERAPARAEPAARRHPAGEAALGLARVPRFADPDLSGRNPVRPEGVDLVLASLPRISQPFDPAAATRLAGTPAPETVVNPFDPLVRAARNVPPEAALSLRSPVARPGRDPRTASPAPAEPAESAVLVAVSPRPPERPRIVAARTPGRATAAQAAVEVARAEAPEAGIAPARLSEDPDRASLFPPRSGRNPCSSRLARDIPHRPGGATDGTTVMARLGNASGRDAALVAEALSGNVPAHLRELRPVRFTGLAGGRHTEIVVCVTPDYLAIGSDRDHVRVPLGLPAAVRIADAFDMMLPTTRMVDAIYAQADLRVSPRPMTPGPQMSSTEYFLRHDRTLDAQFSEAGARDGLLLAGHKKDLVIANRLSRARGRVAIYGWHRSNGDPIQPLSTVHGEYYADYSHGIRLVSRTAYVNGRAVDLRALLTDGAYAGLLNSDGPLNSATVRLASL